MSKTHELKIYPKYFEAILDGWSREVWSKESREWERYTDALPVEAWIA